MTTPTHLSIRGRGATSNDHSARFGLAAMEVDGDWADVRDRIDGPAAPPRTEVTTERARTIITRNTSPDIGFDRSINPYRGCEHGCIYCYARPSHAYHDLSPGIDFETRLFAKPDAAAMLEQELAAASYMPAPIAIGTNTDGFQPIERDWGITRDIIKILDRCGHPLIITTKSDRVVRDIERLSAMAKRDLVHVAISITTLDAGLARTLEPRAPHPHRRLAAVRALAAAGVPVQVNISPIIPAITDGEIEAIMAAAAEAGAYRASYILVRLPHEVAPLFRAWLDAHYPERAAKVMAIIRDIRGGRDNDPDFGSRMRGTGVWADLIRARFRRAAQKYGLDRPPIALSTAHFVPPERDGQMRLF
ncbi:MAG: PA0069 family radical SAM protein [Sphingopyxis sp.]|nr:PA0069 family radical SAM protein [Sphingopyxis sp.]